MVVRFGIAFSENNLPTSINIQNVCILESNNPKLRNLTDGNEGKRMSEFIHECLSLLKPIK